MANEYTGRKEAIGIKKEAVAGVAEAAPDIWIPKEGGVLNPDFSRAEDKSGIGNIFSILAKATTEKFTRLTLPGIISDNLIGFMLLAALGVSTEVQAITILGFGGVGAPAKGDAISSTTGSWTATIKKITTVGTSIYYWVEELTGTIDTQSDVTDGAWTGGTSLVVVATGGHFFEVANSNAHQSFTLFGSNPIGDENAPYGMLDSLELRSEVGDYARFTSEWMAKAIAADSGLAPAFVDENKFLAKHAQVYFAANEAALNGASAEALQSFNFTIAKALKRTQDLGDSDVAVLNNLGFAIAGTFDQIFRNTTVRDFVLNDTEKAARLELIQNNAALIYDSVIGPADDIYPSLIIDLDKITFDGAPKSDGNDELVNQAVEFTALPASGVMVEILLVNSNATGY